MTHHGIQTMQDVETEEGSAERPPLGTEEEFQAMLGELCHDLAPRPFALCEIEGERADGWVFAWGLAFEDGVALCRSDGQPLGRFSSPERAITVFGYAHDLRLVWLDAAA